MIEDTPLFQKLVAKLFVIPYYISQLSKSRLVLNPIHGEEISLMKQSLPIIAVLVFLFTLSCARAGATNPQVQLVTNHGTIVLELYPQKAPKTVDNFLNYVKSGFYDGTVFHRVIKGFMIQGGGFTTEMQEKSTQAPIANEADNGLKNKRGTIAMARTPAPNSATSQFFINTANNRQLNHTGKTSRGWGYCVFGRVTSGMSVVDSIEAVPTAPKGRHRNVPQKQVVITKATVVEAANAPGTSEKQ
jgi:peptidyl-prolyl cis-trans isomerase B (cyclophilin B)